MFPEDLQLKVARYATAHTVQAAMDLFHVSDKTIHKWIQKFNLPRKKIGAPLGNTNHRGGRINPVDAGVKLVHRANSLSI